ncbi:hypothetical protein V8C37DRAFT_368209 [Trichoderma ceciliae]
MSLASLYKPCSVNQTKTHPPHFLLYYSCLPSSQNHHKKQLNKMGIALTNLPYTIFADIISRLSATEAILCRRVSRDVHAALTRVDLSISLILAHFPRSLEGRRLRAYLEADDRGALERGDWAAVFARLARRYFHLGNAVPWKVVKVPVLKDERLLRGVTPWNRFLSLNGKTAPFHFWDPAWTVAPTEGLLVYPAPLGEDADADADADAGAGAGYRARDLDTGLEVKVPFDMRGKIVRRLRISHGILVIEWCEQEASHPLNEFESAHRHYATAYTVRRAGSWGGVIPRRPDGGSASAPAPAPAYTWEFEFRCEYKIHYLGLPVSHQDRFFSTHNGTHYAIYTWQPTRSPWGEDEPLERLIIWEFGTPSPYRPSQDPSGTLKPDDSSGPRIIRSMVNGQLREWGIRQSDTPSLRTMALDECTWDASSGSACGHVFFTQEEHRWSAGPHSSPHPPRLHRVKTTGIPLIGEGPRWVDDCGGGGGVDLRFCCRSRWRRQMTEMDDDDDDDENSGRGNGDGNGDSSTGAACSPGRAWDHSETWPGRAPCWRHDDFPYVTISEIFDASAGVRIIARDCFMLETLSVHIRPKIRVQGVGANGSKSTSSAYGESRRRRRRRRRRSSSGSSSGSGSGSSSSSSNNTSHPNHTQNQNPYMDTSKGGATTQGPDGQEVQFADDMWSEIMAKGFICGDERWLVGEDAKGDVTILVF